MTGTKQSPCVNIYIFKMYLVSPFPPRLLFTASSALGRQDPCARRDERARVDEPPRKGLRVPVKVVLAHPPCFVLGPDTVLSQDVDFGRQEAESPIVKVRTRKDDGRLAGGQDLPHDFEALPVVEDACFVAQNALERVRRGGRVCPQRPDGLLPLQRGRKPRATDAADVAEGRQLGVVVDRGGRVRRPRNARLDQQGS